MLLNPPESKRKRQATTTTSTPKREFFSVRCFVTCLGMSLSSSGGGSNKGSLKGRRMVAVQLGRCRAHGGLAFLGQDGKLVLQSLGKVLFKRRESKARDDLT